MVTRDLVTKPNEHFDQKLHHRLITSCFRFVDGDGMFIEKYLCLCMFRARVVLSVSCFFFAHHHRVLLNAVCVFHFHLSTEGKKLLAFRKIDALFGSILYASIGLMFV